MSIGRRIEIDLVDGLRLGKRIRSAIPQSKNSVLSFANQKSDSSASLAKIGIGLSCFINQPFLFVRISSRNENYPKNLSPCLSTMDKSLRAAPVG